MSATTRAFTSRSSPVSLRRNRPPTASEREGLLALISADNEIIRYISEKAAQRLSASVQASSQVEEWKVGLAEAEKRLDTATSLHEFFLKNNKTPSALDLPPSPTSESPSSVIGPRKQFDNLMAIADTYIQSTRMVVEQAALAVQEARDSVALQRDELQAAMTISMMHQQGHLVLQDQLSMLKKSVGEKEAGFRAIWRVPGEIWRMVFEEAVGPDEGDTEVPTLEEEGYRDVKRKSCETLRFSGVCYSWRSIINSYPDLWSHIHIPNYVMSQDLARINHYYGLCNRSRLEITILAPAALDQRCFKQLYNLFYNATPCKRMTLLIRAPGVPALNGLLPHLPPPTELSIVRYPYIFGSEENERTPTPNIPRSYCSTIRKLDIAAAGAIWQDEPAMRLEKYSIIAPPVSAIFGPHRFIPSSLSSLTQIGIQGRLYDTDPPLVHDRRILPNIAEVVMTTSFLATVFSRHYRMPALHKLAIPTGSSVDADDWQRFLTDVQHNPRGITEVRCYSTDEEIESLADCLTTLRHLESLELRGSSVDLTLELLTAKLEQEPTLFSTLQRLVICSYGGDGNSVRSFLGAMYPPREVGIVGGEDTMEEVVRGKVKLALRECSAMSLETKRSIGQLVELVS